MLEILHSHLHVITQQLQPISEKDTIPFVQSVILEKVSAPITKTCHKRLLQYIVKQQTCQIKPTAHGRDIKRHSIIAWILSCTIVAVEGLFYPEWQ